MILAKTTKIEPEQTFIRGILAKVVLYKAKVEIILCRKKLIKGLEAIITCDTLMDDVKADTKDPIKITKNIRISTTSRNGSVIVYNNAENTEPNINPFLVKTIAKSYYWNKLLDEGRFKAIKEIASIEKDHNIDYIKKAIRLNIFSPRIVGGILAGKQPVDLTVEKLCAIKTLDWKEQETILKF